MQQKMHRTFFKGFRCFFTWKSKWQSSQVLFWLTATQCWMQVSWTYLRVPSHRQGAISCARPVAKAPHRPGPTIDATSASPGPDGHPKLVESWQIRQMGAVVSEEREVIEICLHAAGWKCRSEEGAEVQRSRSPVRGLRMGVEDKVSMGWWRGGVGERLAVEDEDFRETATACWYSTSIT